MAHSNEIAVVRVNGHLTGSGTVVAPRLVLTCRHVVDPHEDDRFTGIKRNKDLDVEGIPVARVFRSPEDPKAYFSDGPDLALLVLKRRISIQPVRLFLDPIASDILRDRCRGWGFVGIDKHFTPCRLSPQWDGLLDEDHIGLNQSTIEKGMSGGPILIENTRDCVGILAMGGIGRAAAVAYSTKLITRLLFRADVSIALALKGIVVEYVHPLRRELLAYVEELDKQADRRTIRGQAGQRSLFKSSTRNEIPESQSGITAIVGPPGCGKTWLLRQEMLKAASKIRDELAAGKEEPGFHLRGEVPLWLTAGDLKGPPNLTMQERIASILNPLFADQPALRSFLTARVRSGRSVVLIDDWKQSSGSLQESLSTWAPNPARRVIVTLTGLTRVPPRAHILKIPPLEPSEIREFVEGSIGDPGQTASLLRIVEGWTEPLSAVPRVPLLLGILCRAFSAAPAESMPATPLDLFHLLDRAVGQTHDAIEPAGLREQLKECWNTLFPPVPLAPACSFAWRFSWQHVQIYKQGKKSRSDASLLVAANEAVPFVGREDLAASLIAWATSPKPVAARTIIGQGGSGKTRLALELANRLSRMGWNCFWAKSVLRQPVAQQTPAGPTLLIFDYASSFKDSLNGALQELLSYQAAHPLRILLLDRIISGWYQGLFANGGSFYGVEELFDHTPLELPPYDSRRDLFQAGLNTWAQRHGRNPLICPEPGVVSGFDQGLESQVWADPLYLLIAAFVAAEYERFEPALEKTRLDLVEYAARKEQGELTQRAAGLADVVSELATINTLAGGCAIGVAEGIAQAKLGQRDLSLDVSAAVNILDDMYGDSRGRLLPIQPDPVAEAYVLLHWKQRDNKTRLIDQSLDDAALAADPAVVATFLVRTGQTFGWIQSTSRNATGDASLRVEVALEALERFLTARQDFGGPEQAVSLLPASTKTVALRALRLRVIQSYRKGFPGDVGLILAEADALASMQRHEEAVDLLRAEAPAIQSEHQRAHALEMGANSWSALGDTEHSIRDLEEAVQIRQRSGEHAGDLASALSNLANRCLEAGLRDKAEVHSRLSVEFYRHLVAEAQSYFADQLGRALCSRATILHDLERQEESIQALREGLALFEELAQENKDRHQPQLGRALINAAVFWAADGQFPAALQASQEAVEIFRELDARLSGVFQEELAIAVRGLSTRLRYMGRLSEARQAASEAVEIHERLAASRPSRFKPELAESLKVLAAAEDRGVAVEVLGRALEHIRPMAQENPRAFEPELSQILATLAGALSEVNRSEEAISLAVEAVAIDRRLAGVSAAFRRDLAQSLRALAVALTGLEQFENALAAIEESITLRRDLGDSKQSGLARSLDLLTKLLALLGRAEQALLPSLEALDIMTALAAQSPETHNPGLAHAQQNHASRLFDLKDFDGALKLAQESIRLSCSLIARNPQWHTDRLAGALALAGDVLRAVGRLHDARLYFAEATVVLLPYLHAGRLTLAGIFAQKYIDVRTELADPLPLPLTNEGLNEELFAEPPLQLGGYSRPERLS